MLHMVYEAVWSCMVGKPRRTLPRGVLGWMSCAGRSARLPVMVSSRESSADVVSRRAESSAKAHSDLLTSLSEVATSSLSSSRLHSAKLAQDIADKTAVIDSTVSLEFQSRLG